MAELLPIQKFLLDVAHSNLPCTDIHIQSGSPVVVNMPGGWVALESDTLTPLSENSLGMPLTFEEDDIKAALSVIDARYQDLFNMGRPVARALQLSDYRMRCNGFTVNGGAAIALSIRKQPIIPPTPAALGLPELVVKATERHKGLFLVTGPTGAGKSTTIASLLNYINERRAAHIITIEKPIEYVLPRRKSIISQKEVGTDVATFPSGLEDALQQRPTVIMIGEIRDRQSAETTLHAAESGHLVFATMHSSTAEGAIAKLLSFVPEEMRQSWAASLSSNLLGIIAQVLAATPDLQGRVAALELLMNTTGQVSKAIAENNCARLRELLDKGGDSGVRSMNAALVDLVTAKLISSSEALEVASDPESLRAALIRLKG